MDADSWTEDTKHKISKRASTDPSKWDRRRLEVPIRLAERLQEYQRDGVRFLHGLYARNLGGLLADDMWKTVGRHLFLRADGVEKLERICIRSQWKGDGEEKSIWQDEENDEEDEEEETRKTRTTTRNGRRKHRREEEMRKRDTSMWGKRELLTKKKRRGKVSTNNRRPILLSFR